jgi:3',5'-cyclic AMP phosphodiesterase CpdA
MIKNLSLILLISSFTVNADTIKKPSIKSEPIKIAFLADIHLHNIYAEIDISSNKDNISLPKDTHNTPLLMRSMKAQLGSTRLFNENYFVFKAALDDLVKRGIKFVALPGDFTDDGQPINVQAVDKILSQYAEQHDMQFFAITGNHDPVRPFTIPGGKSNYLQSNGEELAIYSPKHKNCMSNTKSIACSNAMQYWGYKEIMHTLAGHGFSPKKEYLYYETPFSTPQNKLWSFEASLKETQFEKRQLTWCDDTQQPKCISMPDASYLVEPIPGLWLLAIDANVYQPIESKDGKPIFQGSSGAGYNAMSKFKQPVLDWINSVVIRAKQQNKQLVAFSHFPMTDFYDNASIDIKSLFGDNAFQMKRMPTSETENMLANTGLQLHFAGHMHINDTGTAKSNSDSVLFNIQVPSLAAYQPAYKLLSLSKDGIADIETVVLDIVPNFNSLFDHYLAEWNYRHKHKQPNWNKEILKSTTYSQLTDKHLQGVVDSRYLPKEWPQELVSFMHNTNTNDIVKLALCDKDFNHSQALNKIKHLDLITGSTIIYDLYRLRNADDIAVVPQSRLAAYTLIHQLFESNKACSVDISERKSQLALLFTIIFKMINSEVSGNFSIDLPNNRFVNPSGAASERQ